MDTSGASAAMAQVGSDYQGRPIFWAERGRFTAPGLYAWDEVIRANVLLWAADGVQPHPQAVEAKGLPVAGYKPTQPAWAIDAVNDFKALEERTIRATETLTGSDVDQRWLAIGRTHVQLGFMAINRAVFQPGRIALPEDGEGPLFTTDAKGG